MKDWLRRVDPAFYYKEPHVLRAQAKIARFSDEAQAALRLNVLIDDVVLHLAIGVLAVAAYAAASGAGALDPRRDWPTLWGLAVLAVAGPRALPWWPRRDRAATWRHALIGGALVALPAAWSSDARPILATALLVGATLLVSGGRGRAVVLVVAVAVLFATRAPAYPLLVRPFAGAFAGGASVLIARMLGPAWPRRPQIVSWTALATVLLVCAYAFAFDAPAVTVHPAAEFVAIALAYLCTCIVAARIRRAELIARPGGVLTLPQSIVPLLDRSHDHAIICRLE